MLLLPSTHLFTLRLSFFSAPSAPLDFVFSSLFLVFHAPSLFFPSLTPRIPPPRCLAVVPLPDSLSDFSLLHSHSSFRLISFFFLRMALFLRVLYFLQLLLVSVSVFFSTAIFFAPFLRLYRSTSNPFLRIFLFEENYSPWFLLFLWFAFRSLFRSLPRSRLTHSFFFFASICFPSSTLVLFDAHECACAVDSCISHPIRLKSRTTKTQLSRLICTPSIFLLCSIFHLSKLIYTFFLRYSTGKFFFFLFLLELFPYSNVRIAVFNDRPQLPVHHDHRAICKTVNSQINQYRPRSSILY